MADELEHEHETWAYRIGLELEHIANTDRLTYSHVESMLEAAGELKAVRLKILLGRCYELIHLSESNDKPAQPDEGFLDEILAELKG